MPTNYFIAIYTNAVKAYCDEAFFGNVYSLSNGTPVYVIDNSPTESYCQRLQSMFLNHGYNNFTVYRVEVPLHPAESRFQRNVYESVNCLRELFLGNTDLPYFLILESDVISPADLLARFDRAIASLNEHDPSWGIVGGLYYQGFHNYQFDLRQATKERTQHCLSGCTVYKRELIQKYPFRYDPGNLGPFPDAWICYDAGKEFSLWNDHEILCEHLHNPANGLRCV
jgi:hypothetical protein